MQYDAQRMITLTEMVKTHVTVVYVMVLQKCSNSIKIMLRNGKYQSQHHANLLHRREGNKIMEEIKVVSTPPVQFYKICKAKANMAK